MCWYNFIYYFPPPDRSRTRDIWPSKGFWREQKDGGVQRNVLLCTFLSIRRKPINKSIKSIADVFSFYYIQQHKYFSTNQIQSSYPLFNIYLHVYIIFYTFTLYPAYFLSVLRHQFLDFPVRSGSVIWWSLYTCAKSSLLTIFRLYSLRTKLSSYASPIRDADSIDFKSNYCPWSSLYYPFPLKNILHTIIIIYMCACRPVLFSVINIIFLQRFLIFIDLNYLIIGLYVKGIYCLPQNTFFFIYITIWSIAKLFL